LIFVSAERIPGLLNRRIPTAVTPTQAEGSSRQVGANDGVLRVAFMLFDPAEFAKNYC